MPEPTVLELIIRQYEDPFFFFLNCAAAFAFLVDKAFAITHLWRIRELLLLFCCLNAPIASLLSSFVLSHKIRKPVFAIFGSAGFMLMLAPESVFYYEGWRVLSVLNLGLMIICTILHL